MMHAYLYPTFWFQFWLAAMTPPRHSATVLPFKRHADKA